MPNVSLTNCGASSNNPTSYGALCCDHRSVAYTTLPVQRRTAMTPSLRRFQETTLQQSLELSRKGHTERCAPNIKAIKTARSLSRHQLFKASHLSRSLYGLALRQGHA